MAIVPFPKQSVFEPDAVAVMSEAFDAACRELRDTSNPQVVREIIAERIITAASLGERDPIRLRTAALRGFQDSDAPFMHTDV